MGKIVYICVAFIFSSIWISGVYGQCSISGTILGNKNPLVGATIVIYSAPSTNNILAYGITDVNGKFNINLDFCEDQLLMVSSYLGYTNDTLSINFDETKQQILTRQLNINHQQFKEIVVTASAYLDTNIILIDTNLINDNSSLKEILESSYGFIVSDDGKISYKGKQLNKILINGKEVFVNQNQIALEGIENEMLSRIEVINNYRDRYKVDYENMVETVLNLNTSKSFTGVIKSKLDIAGGVKSKYNSRYTGAYFSDKLNVFTINTFNNVGNKIDQIGRFTNSFQTASALMYNNIIIPSFQNGLNVQSTKRFESNIILKKEYQDLRAAFNVSRLSNTKKIVQDWELYNIQSGEKIFEETRNNEISGGIWHFNLASDLVLNKNSTLGLDVELGFLKSQYDRSQEINNLVTGSFDSNINNTHYSLNANYSIRISSKSLLQIDLNHNIANFKDTIFIPTNSNLKDFNTNHKYNSSQLEATYSYKVNSKFIPNIKMNAQKRLNNVNNNASTYEELVERTLVQYAISGGAIGNTNKFNYSVDIKPTIWHNSYSESSKKYITISSDIEYNINPKNTLIFDFNRNGQYLDIYALMDSLPKSIDQTYISPISDDTFIRSTSGSIGWHHSDILDQFNGFISLDALRRPKYVQYYPSFGDDNQVFYNLIFQENYSSYNLRTGLKKGFYTHDYSNNWIIGGRGFIGIVKFPISDISLETIDFSDLTYGFNANLQWVAESMVFDQLILDFRFNKNIIGSNGQDLLSNLNSTYLLTTKKDYKAFGYSFTGGVNTWTYLNKKFWEPKLNFGIDYNLTKDIEIGMEGFNVGNLIFRQSQNLFVSNEGLIQSRVVVSRPLSYIILKAAIKF